MLERAEPRDVRGIDGRQLVCVTGLELRIIALGFFKRAAARTQLTVEEGLAVDDGALLGREQPIDEAARDGNQDGQADCQADDR